MQQQHDSIVSKYAHLTKPQSLVRVIADDVMVENNPLSFSQPCLTPGSGGKCDCVDRSLTDMCQDCTRLQTDV